MALETYDPATNGATEIIGYQQPYEVILRIKGVAALIFHAWNNEAVEEKSKAAKGSKAKKTDDVNSYIYRTDDGFIAIPGEYLRQSIIEAARYRQDPRSPRKSARDLFKAGIVSLTEMASLGSKEWDYIDRRRVVVQRNAITRERPAFKVGWEAEFHLAVLLPEYIPFDAFVDATVTAGRLVGLADNRPTYGRFQIVKAERL